MIKLSALILLALTLVLVGATPDTNTADPTTRPAAVISAQSELENWVSQFRGSTEKQVVNALGDGAERSTWQSGAKQGLELRYRFSTKSELHLLFGNDHVAYATFTISSK